MPGAVLPDTTALSDGGAGLPESRGNEPCESGELEPVASPPSPYMEKKLAGICTWHRCTREPADGALLCAKHLAKHRKGDAKRKRDVRAARRDAGLCAFCENKSDTYRCPTCAVKSNMIPRSSVRGSVSPDGGAASDPWRKDGDGWARYRGQGRRGAPTAATNDEQDLHAALETFERGRAALAYAYSPEVAALPRIQRRSVRDEATALLALAARFLDDIVERNRGKAGV